MRGHKVSQETRDKMVELYMGGASLVEAAAHFGLLSGSGAIPSKEHNIARSTSLFDKCFELYKKIINHEPY